MSIQHWSMHNTDPHHCNLTGQGSLHFQAGVQEINIYIRLWKTPAHTITSFKTKRKRGGGEWGGRSGKGNRTVGGELWWRESTIYYGLVKGPCYFDSKSYKPQGQGCQTCCIRHGKTAPTGFNSTDAMRVQVIYWRHWHRPARSVIGTDWFSTITIPWRLSRPRDDSSLFLTKYSEFYDLGTRPSPASSFYQVWGVFWRQWNRYYFGRHTREPDRKVPCWSRKRRIKNCSKQTRRRQWHQILQ